MVNKKPLVDINGNIKINKMNNNNLDKQYTDLLQDILDNGREKRDRTGTGTISVFGRQIRHKMSEGFPLLTTKKMAWKTMVTELLWFLRGDTNIKFLVDNGCHIWDGDAYKNYVKWVESPENQNNKNEIVKIPESKEKFIKTIKCDDEIVRKMGRRYCENFAQKWGELGPVYGKQWRSWGYREDLKLVDNNRGNFEYEKVITTGVDQIQNLINDLKTNPDSRRLMVNAWNPSDLPHQVLPPCHYGFQVYTRELTGEERWYLLKERVGGHKFQLMVDDIVPFGGGLSEELQSYNIPKRAISLMFNMRSTDVGLGLGFNLASYGLLLMMIAKQVNMVPDELIYSGGDVHLYKNHIEPIKEQLNREPYPLPIVKLSDRVVNDIADYTLDDIVLENYQSHPTIKLPLSN
jgi:thymidylate synthase